MPTTLNPLAPEYNPISPRITENPHHPPPLPFPPPPPTAVHQLLPPPPTTFSYTYLTSSSYTTVQPFTYYVSQNNPTPPPPPSQEVYGSGQRRRDSPSQLRGGFRAAGRDRERERGWMIERNQRVSRTICKERRFVGHYREENNNRDHEIMPLKWDEQKTTVMIKNIPYDCPRGELIKLLDGFCMMENATGVNGDGTSRTRTKKINFPISGYDFLYLPVDFRTKKSRGFAFVNFTNATTVRKFFNAFHLSTWDFVDWKKWPKKIEIAAAKIQGKKDLVGHFSGSIFQCGSDEFLPVSFSPARDGSGQPVESTVVGRRAAIRHREARR